MRKPVETSTRASKMNGTVKLGLAASVFISRMERLVMSRDMARIFKEFEKAGTSHEDRRAVLVKKYGKSSG